MSIVGLVVHPGRDSAVRAAEQLRSALVFDGVDVPVLDGEGEGAFDLVVSVGGDGTFLRAAHVASRADCPVLGVKVGRMGFLTEVEPPDAEKLIRRVLDGSARIEERLAVTAEPEGGGFAPQWALNEVMVEKRARHRLVRLVVSVDGVYVATFSADGVIVATPTGSTAYSFSARGPIVSPSVPCMVLTPIAAHMVFDRSFVVDATQRVTIEVVGEEMGLVSADGREALELPVGSRLLIGAADRRARLVRRDDAPEFLSLVREKFGLPGEPDPGVGGAG
ncbi:MAG TPA: NAD(+)/NADH kinase [Actinomycetota bacterium]|nr:NAD(+)/NADH kinase [Actinomycetota bacterium]